MCKAATPAEKQAWSNPFSRVAKISALLVGGKRLPETSIALFQSTPSFGEEPKISNYYKK